MRSLEPRERTTLLAGGIAAVVIVLYAFVLSPLTSDLAQKRDSIPRKERELTEMRRLRDEYREMQQRLGQAREAAAKRGPLLTEIEAITKRTNLGGKIVSLKPQTGAQAEGFTESVVEIKLDSITLYDIVNVAYVLERSSLRIKKLTFKPRFDNVKLLNATILVASAG
jgi:hypothetical protein